MLISGTIIIIIIIIIINEIHCDIQSTTCLLFFFYLFSFHLMKITKSTVPRVSPFAQIYTKSFVGALDPTGGAYSASPDPLAD